MKNKLIKTCERCGKVFEVFPSHAKRRNCSADCGRSLRFHKTCVLCGAPFVVTESRAEQQYCSKKCSNSVNSIAATAAQKAADEVVALVPAMVDLHNQGKAAHEIAAELDVTAPIVRYRLGLLGIRLPRGNRKPWNPAMQQNRADYFRTHKAHNYKDLPIDEMRQLYEGGMSGVRVGSMFGVSESVVLDRMQAAGVTIHNAGWSYVRAAKDGHLVQSSLEEAIDNWLFDHGLEHDVHPRCPWVSKGLGQHHADFRVGETYIEVWGMIKNKKYQADRAKKIALYAAHNTSLIQIEPKHILNHDYSPLDPLLGV